jgi:hypothetical protein
MVDATGSNYGGQISNCTVTVNLNGIGIKAATQYGIIGSSSSRVNIYSSGVYGCGIAGIYAAYSNFILTRYSGLVGNNTANSSVGGGARLYSVLSSDITGNGISDNLRRGVFAESGGFAYLNGNFGDNNGTWGAYAQYSAQIRVNGTECSGSSGNHSNGTGDGSLAY